ncbi:peptidylprolyl isomerase [Novosphingobium sp. B-7]|uniref:peptidylprolyl isomerase n=1 Tax=Novosphingobium sp. B-7 TaxID=1298855 RepID=UPI0003B79250|nr:peptidylprolyl isomerase [Novosphingobium sp. B-7]
MLSLFRKLIHSRIGALFALVFIGLLALAFAGADVSGLRIGQSSDGEAAAKVGHARVGVDELGKTITTAFEQEREQNPTLTMRQFLAQGVMNDALSGLADRAAMQEWAAKNGMGVSDRLVDSEIAKQPAFQGPDGKFSDAVYRAFLAQRGMTDAAVRKSITQSLIARQVLSPVAPGAAMPASAVARYAAMLKEKREGDIAFLPSIAFAGKDKPSDAVLATYYKANAARYQQPERRTVRYAVIDEASLANVPAPSDADIAARYKAKADVYAPSETRTVTQVVVPTEQAAQALAVQVSAGTSIEAAARAKGLAASKIADLTRDKLAAQSSAAVADAVFAAAQGKVATPAKSGLGWHVIRVDAIVKKPGKTLEQARPELVAELTTEKRHAALLDLSSRLEEQFENHTGLADVAKAQGVTLTTTPALTADGSVFGQPGQKAPADVAALLQGAFALEHEGEGQVAPLADGKRIAIFDVGQIMPAAPAPLDQIKDQVARDYATEQGAAKAKDASAKVLAAMAKGASLADALKGVGVTLPPAQPVAITREQLAAMQQSGRQLPPPLVLLFAMSKGTAKPLAAPGNAGFYVVSLKTVTPGVIPAGDPFLAQAGKQFGLDMGREVAEELRTAIRNQVGVTRNETALRALNTKLVGNQ